MTTSTTDILHIANPLAWLKGEIDRSLALAREALGQSLTQNDERAALLERAGQHLRQVRGALNMLRLDGAARFCAALEDAAAACASGEATLTRVNVSIIDRAIFALLQFLDDLAKGEPDVPLKLFPVYRELGEISGRTSIAENELFFPDLTPVPPERVQSSGSPSDASARLIACRSQFQRGLLAWLTQPAKAQGLHSMRAALDEFDRSATALPVPPGMWWAAAGLIDTLAQPDERLPPSALAPIFSRIERYMRDLASGQAGDAAPLMRDILYPLALCAPVSRRVREVKNLYHLDAQVPEFCVSGTLEYDVSALAPVLDDMRRRLAAIEDAWARYTAGSGEHLRRLREEVTGLKTIARDLGHYRLVRLLDIVSLIASKLPDPYPKDNEILALEMAAAFLFMEGMLDHFTSPPADIDQQVAVMVGWLLDAVKPRGNVAKSGGAPRDDITQRQQFTQIRGQVAHEILENLRQVEQTIDQIARDPAARDAIATLEPPVRQIAGALKMLGLNRANGVLSACLHLMKLSVSEDPTLTRASLEWVADGLSCLGFYLEALKRGENPTEGILLGFVQRLGRDDARPAGATGWIPAASDLPVDEVDLDFAESAVDLATEYGESPGDWEPLPVTELVPESELVIPTESPILREMRDAQELRAVYVEEAQEVLDTIAHATVRLRASPTDVDALTYVRRGFHTLKGSGRLVGLDALGEFACEIERTLNYWLHEQLPASAALLDTIEAASRALRAAIEVLRAGREPDLAGDAGIIARASALRVPEVAAEPVVAAVVEPEVLAPTDAATQPPPVEVVIGDVRLSETLFQIYLRESAAHLATLESELDQIEQDRELVLSASLTRAAHTLKSSSRTTGFLAVADLAEALEQSLHRYEDARPARAALEAFHEARMALAGMLSEIRLHRLPLPANAERAALVDALRTTPHEEVPEDVDEPVAPAMPSPLEIGAEASELDLQLLPVFLEEAHQLLPQISDDLKSWRARPGDVQPARGLARALHTLKGSARMAGAMRIGELTHAVESRVGMAIESGEHDAELYADIERDVDQVGEWIDALEAHAPRLTRAALASASPSASADPANPGPLPIPSTSLRVDPDVLDRLVNQAGEISIARERIEGEMEAFRAALNDLTDSVARLRTQLRETQVQADSQMQSRMSELKRDERDFDPLELDRYTRLQELTRMMAESLHDIQIIQHTLLTNSSETENALALQGRIGRDLQQDLLELRSVPFGMLTERLERTVRQTARQVGREADLMLNGTALELDRSVLQRIAAPLEHMLRNAVAHGIEPANERESSGKPRGGTITLELVQEGSENLIVLSDDGAGLDPELIRMEALRLGLVGPSESVSDAALSHMIFAPGFSTAQSITETAGRGIGLDVVRSEVAAIGGSIEVASTRGVGTTFRIRFPLTLAAAQVILVRAQGTYAIPATLIEQVREIRPEELSAIYDAGTISWESNDYPLHYLPRLLGEARGEPEIRRHNPVLLLRGGDHRVAIHVDQVIRNQEVVLKHIGPQLARAPGVVGATVLGTGQIVLIMNPLQLAASGSIGAIEQKLPAARVIQATAPQATVLVVDDSLTVRRLTGRLLAREGYQVATAKDGVDALVQMQENIPDLIILDIEMPRMDGFELAKQLRSNARTAAIPIVVVSSRMAEKHQRHALDLGVNAFFGKPYPEDELLACVAELLGRGSAVRAA